MKPTLRKPVGVLGIIIGLAVYAVLIATAAPWLGKLHTFLQTSIYLILGIIWIMPLKPLLRWMETGKWNVIR